MAPSAEHRRARRAYGQNFLHPRYAAALVEAARPGPDDLVYEAGAGRGSLTAALVGRCGQVVAYEVDPGLAAAIPRHARVTVRVEDFLAATSPGRPFAVVGNVPYGLTSALVDWCLHAPDLTSATLLTQLEYARKRTGDYGRWSRLTIRTWPQFSWRLAGRVPRTAFRPVPGVDGGILRLARRPEPLVQADRLAAYGRLVDLGFAGGGGPLAASLSPHYERQRITAAMRATRLPAGAPVGQVWPEQWLTLFRLLDR